MPNTTNFVHEKKARKSKVKLKEFEIKQKVSVKNYNQEAKSKIDGIVARGGKLHYRIQFGSKFRKDMFIKLLM